MVVSEATEFRVLLAQPRAFCAGVERAILAVERALDQRAAHDTRPVYVRHEIVHNRTVVDGLRARGAVFVDEGPALDASGTGRSSAGLRGEWLGWPRVLYSAG